MLSYKNNPQLKKDFLREIRKHKKQDMILQGTYGKQNGGWKGCAVACSVRSLAILNGEELKIEYNDHKRYETDLGIPEWLARLEDTIFEGIPEEEAKEWVVKFPNAIPVGKDLEPIKWKFCAYLMKENIDRVLKLDIDDKLKKQVVDSIRKVLQVHTKAIETGVWDESAAQSAARSAAWSAWSAAESAAESARSAAQSAAESAESAAESARSAAWSAWSAARSAWSAARSAAQSAAESAWSAACKKHAKELLKLLKQA